MRQNYVQCYIAYAFRVEIVCITHHNLNPERRGRVFNNHASNSGGPRFECRSGDWLY
jgi:hypothetical protein